MQLQSLRRTLIMLLYAIVLILCLAACSAGEAPDVPAADSPGEEPIEPPQALSPPVTMGVALDPSGDTIPLARVGSEIGDFNGVISGDLEVSEAGWFTVEAVGSAPGFTRPFGEFNGVEVFSVRLTPFSHGIVIEGEEPASFVFGEEGTPIIEVEIPAGSFSAPQTTIAAAIIDRLDVGPGYHPVDGSRDLYLHHAFALQSYDTSWEDTSLEPGMTYALQIQIPPGMTDQPTLATFDPKRGEWTGLTEACGFSDQGVLDCTLGAFSPLFGLFSENAPALAEIQAPLTAHAAGSQGSGARMSIRPAPSPQTGQWDDAFQQAIDKIAEWLNEGDRSYYLEDGPEPTLDDPELLDLIDDLIDAAVRYANENRNESGKIHLMQASALAQLLGQDQMSEAPAKEAAHISYKMGEEILKDPDCGKYREAFKIAEQNMFFMYPDIDNQGMADKIINTYLALMDDCDIWDGTIDVRLDVLKTHPVTQFTLEGSPPYWWELHAVRISTNVGTYYSRAEDTVRNMFYGTTYIYQSDCTCSIRYSSQQKPIFLTSEGTYDGYTFKMNNLMPQEATGFTTITQKWDFRSKYGDPPTCQPDPGGQQSFELGNYWSVLSHGFLDEGPPVPFQQMLEAGDPSGDIIQGNRDFSNPDQESGRYPVSGGNVSWTFNHTQKKLPLPE
jgi:hypothetical protein